MESMENFEWGEESEAQRWHVGLETSTHGVGTSGVYSEADITAGMAGYEFVKKLHQDISKL